MKKLRITFADQIEFASEDGWIGHVKKVILDLQARVKELESKLKEQENS